MTAITLPTPGSPLDSNTWGNTLNAAITTVRDAADATAASKVDKGTLVISVKDAPYGAVGNGSTDDTTAILAANTAVGAVGGTLFFPQGQYKITATIPVKRDVTYSGPGSGYIFGTAYGAVINPATDSLAAFTVRENVSQFAIQKLAISGNGTNTGLIGIYMHGDVAVGSSTAGKIKRVRFFNLDKGIYAKTDTGAEWQIDNVTVSNCRFDQVNYGIHVNSANASMWSIKDCGIAANTGIWHEQANCMRIVNCLGAGFAGGSDETFFRHGSATRAGGSDITITNCQNEAADYFAKYDGLTGYPDVGNTTFTSCEINLPIVCPVAKRLTFINNRFYPSPVLDLTGSTGTMVYTIGNSGTLLTGALPAGNRIFDLESTAKSVVGTANESARSATTTLTSADLGRMQACTVSSAFTLTLPTPVGIAGQVIGVRVAPSSTQLLTLATAAGNIDGVSTRVMWAGESATLESDGTNWVKIAGRSIPMQASIGQTAAQTITSGTVTTALLDTSRRNNTGLMVNTASNRIDILRPGTYVVSAQPALGQPATTIQRYIAIAQKNGTTTVVQQEQSGITSGGFPAFAAIDTASLAAGDYVKLQTYQLCVTPASIALGVGAGPDKSSLTVREIPEW